MLLEHDLGADAVVEAKRAEALEPKSVDPHRLLAQIYESTKKPNEAVAEWNTVLALADRKLPGGAQYAVLHGGADSPPGWLLAGQALSAAWLTASELDVSVMPISSVVEVPVTRRALRELLAGRTWPYLVLRLGLTDPGDGGPVATPRLPASRTVPDRPG